MANGTGYIFKGDLMQESEFSSQVYKAGATDGSMGLAIAVDGSNYLIIRIDTAADQLVIEGAEGGVGISAPAVSVANKADYNLRAVKLSGRVIVFVDGVEKQSINVGYGPAQAGLYVDGMSARFNGIMAYRTEPDAIPSPWTTTDIGAVGFPGTADYSDDALYMTGSGSDIWHLNDEFTFMHQDIAGDWEITSRVVNLDESDYWSKAALMFRNDLAGNSGMVMMNVTGGDLGLGHVQMIWRNNAGEGTPAHDVSGLSYPIWLKLKRQGSVFSGYYSSDGQNWTLLGSETPPLNAAGQLGFGVTSHNNDRIATAVFDRIELKHLSYDAWVSGYGLSGSSADRGADPDGDGMDNFSEYALGGNPNVPDAETILPTYGITDVGGGSNVMDYIYNRRINAASLGLTYGLNTSDDLMDAWIYAGTAYETGTTDIDLYFESVSNSIPVTGTEGFIQLKITED